jgi:hypothetical protein
MKVQPLVLTATFCDQLLVHPLSQQVSLIGLFNAICLPVVPHAYKRFWFFATLNGGHGTYTARTTLRCMESDGVLWDEHDVPLKFESPQQNINARAWFPMLAFKTFGTHLLDMHLDGELLLTRRLEVLDERRYQQHVKKESV